ncbi:MAG TPA: SBBP repeat-containing protein, partial [Desulfuromonadales bacterium]
MNAMLCRGSWSAVLLALTLTACDGGGGGGGSGAGGAPPGDVTPPAIVSTLPVDGASGVTQTTVVTATFSEAVAAASVSPLTYSLSAGALPVNGLLTVSGPVVTFTPSAPLALGTQFTARLAVGITDLAGNALAAPFTWIFTTEAAPWPGTRQLGTPTPDSGNSVATDRAGNVYVAGITSEDLDGAGGDPLFGGVDLFLAKFGPAGNLLFTRQLGTVSTDEATGVAVDGVGNVYVAGSTSGDLDGVGGDPLFGGVDLFLAKFNPAGNLLFTRQLGTVSTDEATGVAVDGVGNVYVAGSTNGDLDGAGGDPVLGGTDFFLAKFDASGNLLFTRQLGTTATDDDARGVAVDGTGNVYVAGSTNGDLDGVGGDPVLGGTDF